MVSTWNGILEQKEFLKPTSLLSRWRNWDSNRSQNLPKGISKSESKSGAEESTKNQSQRPPGMREPHSSAMKTRLLVFLSLCFLCFQNGVNLYEFSIYLIFTSKEQLTMMHITTDHDWKLQIWNKMQLTNKTENYSFYYACNWAGKYIMEETGLRGSKSVQWKENAFHHQSYLNTLWSTCRTY